MSETEVENVVVRFKGDHQSYDQTIDHINKRMEGMLSRATRIGTRMSVALTAPLVLFKGVAVNAFASFDDAMVKSTSIMSGITADIDKQMRQTALTISKQTGAAARDLAEGYFFLASAGFDARQSMAALPAVAQFARAGAFDLARATDLLTDAQTALGLSFKDPTKNLKEMTRLSDVLVKANTLANASVEQFSVSLTTKSAAALRSVNKEVEEGVAVLAAFADQGMKAHRSGEALTDMMTGLKQAATNENTKGFFKEFQIDIFDTEGKMRHLADIVEDFEKAFAGASDEQRQMMLSQMGIRESSSQAITTLQGTSEKIRAYEKALKEAGGTTEDVAKKQMASFTAQLGITRAKVTALSIDVGRILAPSVARFNDVLERGTEVWDTWSEGTKKATVAVGGLAAATGPALVTIGLIGPTAIRGAQAVKMMTIAVWGFVRASAVAAAAAALPFAPYIVGAAAVVAVIMGLIRLIGGPGSLNAMWEKVKGTAKSVFDSIRGFIFNFRENMGAIAEWVKGVWQNLGTIITTYFKNSLSNAGVIWGGFARMIMATIGWVGVQLPQLAREASIKFGLAIAEGMQKMVEIVVMAVDALAPAFHEFAIFVADVFVGIVKAATKTMGLVGRAFMEGLRLIKKRDFIGLGLMMTDTFNEASETVKGSIAGITMSAAEASTAALAKLVEFKNQLMADFMKGATTRNLFGVLGDIWGEQTGKLKNPFEGMGLPELNLDIPKPAGLDVPDVEPKMGLDTDEADQKNDEIRDKLGKPIMIPVGVQGTLANSTDAIAKQISQGLQSKIKAPQVTPHVVIPQPTPALTRGMRARAMRQPEAHQRIMERREQEKLERAERVARRAENRPDFVGPPRPEKTKVEVVLENGPMIQIMTQIAKNTDPKNQKKKEPLKVETKSAGLAPANLTGSEA